MKITAFYIKPKKFRMMNKRKIQELIRFCGIAFVAVTAANSTPALADTGSGIVRGIAATTFGPGGPGVLIISLLLMALVGWLAGYIAQAAGKGQIAGMIHVVTVFSCISLVADAAFKVLGSLAKFLG